MGGHMRIWLVSLAILGLLMLGCLGSSAPPAPEYRGPAVGNNTPAALPPKPKPVVNNTSAVPPNATIPPKANVTVPPKQNVSAPNASAQNASNASAGNVPAPGVSNNATLPPSPALVCNGSTSSDALECISQAAVSQKNVALCIQLAVKDARYQCLTRWCYSAARDFHQCEKLTNTDDRLGCLNKCNPNFNT